MEKYLGAIRAAQKAWHAAVASMLRQGPNVMGDGTEAQAFSVYVAAIVRAQEAGCTLPYPYDAIGREYGQS